MALYLSATSFNLKSPHESDEKQTYLSLYPLDSQGVLLLQIPGGQCHCQKKEKSFPTVNVVGLEFNDKPEHSPLSRFVINSLICIM